MQTTCLDKIYNPLILERLTFRVDNQVTMERRKGHVIIQVHDSDTDTDQSSTGTSEVSDAAVANGNINHLATTTGARGRNTQSSHTSPENESKRGKKRHRKRKKRKLKTTPTNASNRSTRKDTSSQNGTSASKENKDATNRVINATKLVENGVCTLKPEVGTKTQDGRSTVFNGASLSRRIHSAPAVISKRMSRKEYIPTKPLIYDVTDSKTGSRTQNGVNGHAGDKELFKSSSNVEGLNNGVVSLTPVHLERQKSVLNSLQNTIQRSLPPVNSLPMHSLTFNNKQRHLSNPNTLHPIAAAMALQNTNVSSKIFLRYAQPYTQPIHMHSTHANRRVGNNSARATHVANFALEPPAFRAGMNGRIEPHPQPNVTRINVQSSHVVSDSENGNASSSSSRPKSILRKERTEVTVVSVSRRKSVRFNNNDQIKQIE